MLEFSTDYAIAVYQKLGQILLERHLHIIPAMYYFYPVIKYPL